MQLYFILVVVFTVLVAINAQFASNPPAFVPGGESPIAENNPIVQDVKKLIIQELSSQARTLPGSPSVDIYNFAAKQQVVAGIRYNTAFTARYIYSTGEQITKSCTANVIEPLGANSRLTFIEDYNTKEKIRCR